MVATAKNAQHFTTDLHHWHFDHQCAGNGNRDGPGGEGKAVLFCMKLDSPSDPCPVAVEIDNNAGSVLWVAALSAVSNSELAESNDHK